MINNKWSIGDITSSLTKYEAESKILEPGPQIRKKWLKQVAKYAEEFLEWTEEAPTYLKDAEEAQKISSLGIDQGPHDLEDLLKLLKSAVDRPGLNPASGGHLGYIPGGGLYPSALADFMVDITNRYAGIYFANPGAIKMENELIRWMNQLVGYGDVALGNLSSGGSIANLIAVTTARDAKKLKARDIPDAVVYLSEQTHHCVHKALRIAGLQEAHWRIVPLNNQFKMDVNALEKLISIDKSRGLRPFLLIASLGSTDTGAVDPLSQLADVCEKEGIWFHLDAAYGGFFILADSLKEKFVGIDRTDSIVMDPHKTLFLPYGCGAVLVRNGKEMFTSHYYRANYMQDTLEANEEVSPADLSPELTKHFRGLRMWLPLQLFGIEPFKAGLEEKHLLVKYFYIKVQELGFEVGPVPELSVCIYRYVPETGDVDNFNKRLVEEIQQDGRVFISSTTIDGVYWIRLAAVCFRTHKHWIDKYLSMLGGKLSELKKLKCK